MKIFLTTCVVTGHDGPTTRYVMGPAETREAAIANFVLKEGVGRDRNRSISDIRVEEIQRGMIESWCEVIGLR